MGRGECVTVLGTGSCDGVPDNIVRGGEVE
jgi:hypothetical protein